MLCTLYSTGNLGIVKARQILINPMIKRLAAMRIKKLLRPNNCSQKTAVIGPVIDVNPLIRIIVPLAGTISEGLK